MQTDIHTYRQTDRQIYTHMQTDRQTDRLTIFTQLFTMCNCMRMNNIEQTAGSRIHNAARQTQTDCAFNPRAYVTQSCHIFFIALIIIALLPDTCMLNWLQLYA